MELPLIIDLETKRVLNAIFSGVKQATIPTQTRPPIPENWLYTARVV